jgi:SAM-dependent methyltransferase
MATKTKFQEFERHLNLTCELWKTYQNNPLNTNISPDDDMYHREWDYSKSAYISAGEGALSIIAHAMMLSGNFTVDTILDMPCGFGRVTRHLRAAFPDARIYACDLYDNRITYCAEKFNAIPFQSRENFLDIEFPEKFDLIWCGSLLSHLPEPLFTEAFRLFSRSLNENGVALVTILGRISPYIQRNCFLYLPEEAFDRVEKEFRRTGFGYADYNMQETFNQQNSYGIAVVSPSYVTRCLEDDYSIRIHGYIESGWDKQQDVIILKKTPVNNW